MDTPEIQRADPAARRRAAAWAAVVAAVGLPCAWAAGHYRGAWTAWLDANLTTLRAHLWIVPVAALLAMVPLLIVAARARRLGARVVEAERFPPPGHAVVHDTTVQTGESAVRRGRLLQGLGVALGTSCLCVPVLAYVVARALTG